MSFRIEPSSSTCPPGARWSDELLGELRLVARVPGMERRFVSPVFRWGRHGVVALAADALRELPVAVDREFLVVQEEAREIHCLPGVWEIREPVVIPAGYRLLAGPGVRWDLRQDAFVLSYSPVEFVGSEDQPVVIESTDRSGDGLVVLAAQSGSRLEHVVFRGLSAPTRDGWKLAGATTFYESPVRIADAVFAENRSGDDLVNLFRSTFSIERTVFRGAVADALDVDFCDGRVEDVIFRDVGDDAIGTSGSQVEVIEVTVEGAGGRAMSFAAGSRATVRGANISRVRLGMASVDDSTVRVTDSAILDSEFGLAVFTERPEFGPSSLKAVALELKGLQNEALVERGAVLVLDGEQRAAELEDVQSLVSR